MMHVSICPSGEFSQQENYSIFMKSVMDVIRNHIEPAKPYQTFFRSSALNCQIFRGGRPNQRACPVHTSFSQRLYKYVKAQGQKLIELNAIWNENIENLFLCSLV